ncbi:MAG: lycopene cyclase domain-containing protein [Candidatus Binatia bacterium]
MSFTYLLINGFIIAIPLALTFDKRTAYYRQIPAVGLSTGVVGACYLIWDVLVTARGEWSFNGKYLTGVHLLNLPLEEVLFFITVPYSCLFIYEVVLYATKERFYKMSTPVLIAAIVLLMAAGMAVRDQGYTLKALASCSFFLTVAYWLDRPLLTSRRYWTWLAICYIPFLLVNSVLTALPVVEYNPKAIFGLRVFTIPIEDFFYNYAMLSFYLLFYRLRRKSLEP